MYASEITWNSYWWIFPIVMMALCFFMMRGGRGFRMCCFGPRNVDDHQSKGSDSALEILAKRYASGEINKDEFEERRKTLTDSMDSINQ